MNQRLKGHNWLRDYQCIIASVTPTFDRTFFQNTPNLGLLCRHGLGVDNVDLSAATENQVLVTKVLGPIERQAVAEHAIALLMNELRKINKGQRLIKNDEWHLRSSCNSFELKHATVGVIGYGNIGSKVGQILHEGFGAEVLVYLCRNYCQKRMSSHFTAIFQMKTSGCFLMQLLIK